MSLIDRLPTRRERKPRKHRAADRITRLEVENAILQRQLAAVEQQDTKMTALERGLAAERWARAVAERELEQAEKTIRLRDEEIAGLKRTAGIRAQAENVITPTQEITADQVVHALWDARDSGLLGPVTDPGRIGP